MKPKLEPDTEATDALLASTNDLSEEAVGDARLVECSVCFIPAPSSAMLSQICHDSCQGSICGACMAHYLDASMKATPRGIRCRLKCPICVRPVNLQRVVAKSVTCNVDLEEQAQAYREHIEASCAIACPECHYTYNLLSEAPLVDEAIDNQRDFRRWSDELLYGDPAHFPQLAATWIGYCNFEVSTDEVVVASAHLVPQDRPLWYANILLEHIYDPERRVALFMAILKINPFVVTNCCIANVCFVCQRAGHHRGTPCSAFLPDVEEIAQCPHCDLMLVKGDGCSTISCYCGQRFEWPVEAGKHQLNVRAAEALASQRADLRKRFTLVLGQLPRVCAGPTRGDKVAAVSKSSSSAHN